MYKKIKKKKTIIIIFNINLKELLTYNVYKFSTIIQLNKHNNIRKSFKLSN